MRQPRIEIPMTRWASAFRGDTQIKIIPDQNVNEWIYQGWDCHYKMCNMAILYTVWQKVLHCCITYIQHMPIWRVQMFACVEQQVAVLVWLAVTHAQDGLWWQKTIQGNKHMINTDRVFDYVNQ